MATDDGGNQTYEDYFDEARDATIKKADDPDFGRFIEQWFLEEIRMLTADKDAAASLRSAFVQAWDPRSSKMFEGTRAVTHHVTMLAAELESRRRATTFELHPWVLESWAAVVLEGLHASCLGYWLASGASSGASTLGPDMETYVRTAVASTIPMLGRVRAPAPPKAPTAIPTPTPTQPTN